MSSNKISTAVLEIRTDIDPMLSGLTKAEQRGKQFGDSFKKVSQQTDTFSGAIGKAGPMLAGFGVSLSVTAAVQFGKQLLDDADALMKLSDKTGVSLQGLQRFQVAGDDAGNTVDQLTGAITKMEDKLVSGDKSALAALTKLGIPFSDIKNLSPENQFIAISDALRQVQDPAQQIAIAMDLFGKQGAEVLPTLKRGFDDVKNAAVGMSDETVRALDEAGDAIAILLRGIKVGSSEALVGLIHFAQDGVGMIGYEGRKAAREIGELNDQLKRMGEALPPGQKAMAAALPAITSDSPAVVRAIKEQEEASKKAASAAKEAAADYAAFRVKLNDVIKASYTGKEAMRALAQGLENVGETVHDIDPLIQHFKDLNTEMKAAAAAVKEVSLAWPSAVQTMSSALGGSELPGVRSTVGMIGTLAPALKGIKSESTHAIDGIQGLARAFSDLAQVSGDSWGGIAQDIGVAVSSLNLALESVQQYGKATTNMGRAAAVASAAASVWSATGSGSTGSRTLSGAASGAAAGSVVPGWGTAVGAGIGALVGYFRGREANNIGKQVNDLRDQFQDMFDAGANGFAHLNQAAHEAGLTLDHFLGAQTLDQWTEAQRELTVALQHHQDIIAGASQFGPSQKELASLAQEAHEVFDFMQKDGGYTSEQLSKAFLAYQHALADAGNAAAQAWLKVHDPIESAASASNKALDDLKAQFKGLADSVAGEAPEENMGVIESQTRAQMAVLKDQIDQTARDLDAQANEAADAFETAMAGIDPETIDVPWRFVQVGEGLPGAIPMANGGFGQVDRPTLFLAGERGSEQFAFSGANRKFSSGDDGGTGGTVILHLDGREIARASFPHLYDTVQAYGLGR